MLSGMTKLKTPDTPTDAPPPTTEQLLAELAASGMKTAAFARSRGLPPWKLYNAIQTRAKRAARKAKSSTLIPVRLEKQSCAQATPFELVLAGGYRLLVPADFDAGALRRLMGALAGC